MVSHCTDVLDISLGPWLVIDISSSLKSRLSTYYQEKYDLDRCSFRAWEGIILFHVKQDSHLQAIDAKLEYLHQVVRSTCSDPYVRRFINSVSVCSGSLCCTDKADVQMKVLENLGHEMKADGSEIYRLQLYPKSLVPIYGPLIPVQIPLHPKEYTHVIFGLQISPNYFLFGKTCKSQHFGSNQESRADKNRKLVSRAYFKIRDVIDRLPECIRALVNERSVAIEIGASPGGWTQYLCEKVGLAIAIDPAALDPAILEHSNVVHIRKKAELCTKQVSELYSKFQTTHEDNPKMSINLLVCDANKPVEAIMALLEPFEDMMPSGSVLVLTLKFLHTPQIGSKRAYKNDSSEEIISVLSPRWKDIHIDWLMSNQREERTIWAVKR